VADVQPVVEQTTAPPPVVLNGSALPQAVAAVAEIESANDDAAPDSGEVAVAKARETEPEAKAKAKEPVKPEPGSAAVKMRTDRPDRPERRTRERKGRGRSTPPPPATETKASAEPALASAFAEPTDSPDRVAGHDKAAGPPADLDERFFAEGVHSEHEMLAAAVTAARPNAPMEEEIDPKILLKLQPDVRARRAKFGSVAKWVSIVCVVLISVAVFVRYRNGQSGQEAAEREMAAYAAAHTYTEPTDKPPPPVAPTPVAQGAAAAPTAATSAELEAVPPPPAESAAANPAAPNAVGEKGPLGPEAKAVAAVAPGAAPGAAQTDTEAPPAKNAQQEKRAAQALLERGAFGNAAAAGERSVALDPSDGEAWLLLGAAYESQGRKGDARRSYNNCLTQAKRGPIGECRAMLQ